MSDTRSREELLEALKTSPAYIRAYEDIRFIHKEDLRPVRLQLELLKPELVQNEQGVRSTVVVFGSARIPEPEQARIAVEKAKRDAEKAPTDAKVAQKVKIAERMLHSSRYYVEARNFARIVSSTCQINGQCDFVIVTGGGPGIMEAANRGAFDVSAKSIGLNITLPHEQEPNPYVSPELCFLFHYFAIRKMHFLLRARALVVFPGGFGTFDELFETLTLIQNEKMTPVPVILFGREFWDRALDLEYLVEEGVISPHDIHLIEFVETAEEAWQIILEHYGGLQGLARLANGGDHA